MTFGEASKLNLSDLMIKELNGILRVVFAKHECKLTVAKKFHGRTQQLFQIATSKSIHNLGDKRRVAFI